MKHNPKFVTFKTDRMSKKSLFVICYLKIFICLFAYLLSERKGLFVEKKDRSRTIWIWTLEASHYGHRLWPNFGRESKEMPINEPNSLASQFERGLSI